MAKPSISALMVPSGQVGTLRSDRPQPLIIKKVRDRSPLLVTAAMWSSSPDQAGLATICIGIFQEG